MAASREQAIKNLGEHAQNGGPGKPKGGRRIALDILDRMLAKAGNQEILEITLEDKFKGDPYKFFKEIIMPLVPKGIDIAMGDETLTGFQIIVKKTDDS